MYHICVFFAEDGREWGNYLASMLNTNALDLHVDTLDLARLEEEGWKPPTNSYQTALVKLLLVSPDFLPFCGDTLPFWFPDPGDDSQSVIALLCSVNAHEFTRSGPFSHWTILHLDVSLDAVHKLIENIARQVDECENKKTIPVPVPKPKPRRNLGNTGKSTGKQGGLVALQEPSTDQVRSDERLNPRQEVEKRPEQSVRAGTDTGECDKQSNVMIPMRQKFRIKRIFPTRVTTPGDEVAIIFSEPPGNSGALEVDIQGVRIQPKQLNSYTYVFKPSSDISGKVQIQIFQGSEMLNSFPMIFASQDQSAFSYRYLLEQALGIHYKDTDTLDEKLLEIFNKSVPGDDLDLVFSKLLSSKNEASVPKSDKQLPTLLHFAAYNGFQELTCRLLELPGALLAYQQENCNGHDPSQLAEEEGHAELAEYLRNFMETKIAVDMVDDMYVEIHGHSLLYENTRAMVPTGDNDLYTYARMRYSSRVPCVEEEEDIGPDVYLKGHPTEIIPDRLPRPGKTRTLPGKTPPRVSSVEQKKASTLPTGFSFGNVQPSPGTVGSRSLEELKRIQILVAEGKFSIEDARNLFEAWKNRYAEPTRSFKGRQQALTTLRETFRGTLEKAEESKQKSNLGQFLTKIRMTRKRPKDNHHAMNFYVRDLASDAPDEIYEDMSGGDMNQPIYSEPAEPKNRASNSSCNSLASSGSRDSRSSRGSLDSSGLGSSTEETAWHPDPHDTYPHRTIDSRRPERSRGMSRRERILQNPSAISVRPAPMIPPRTKAGQRRPMPTPPRT